MIYLDCAATTKPSSSAVREFLRVTDEAWMNPSSKLYSTTAANELTAARQKIANVIGSRPDQIIFTSGSTEAANWVMRQGWDSIIASAVEHPAVMNTGLHLDCGFHLVDVDGDGVVNMSSLFRLLEVFRYHKRILVAIMGANNETGTLQPLNTIWGVTQRYPNVKLFVDNTQLWAHPPAGGIEYCDYACASAHKFGGFKGTGFLYAKDPGTLSPLLCGGHQESGLRAGTENVSGIVAMAAAFEETHRLGNDYAPPIRDHICSLAASLNMKINGGERTIPNIVSLTMPDCDAQSMIAALAMDEIYLSAGSACSSGDPEPSYTLTAMGLSPEEARRTIRISFDRRVRIEDIDVLFDKIKSYREVLR